MNVNVISSLISYDTLNPDDWAYKCEGNVNVILSYQGNEPHLIGKVLRVRKCEEFDVDDSSELFTHLYVKHIIRSFIGENLVDPGTPIKVDRQFLEAIQRKIEPFRPKHRLQGVGSNLKLDAAISILMQDFTHLPVRNDKNVGKRHVYSVEIKPKWGILCHSGYVDDESIKKHVCRYCMHQHVKLEKGEITRTSKFCPLDLFSADPKRVRIALEDLIRDPQNNMRLYIDSDLVWFGYMKQTIVPDYYENLRKILQEKFFVQNGKDTVEEFLNILQQCLTLSDVLPRIRRMQLFDKIDVEAAHVIFKHLTKNESLEQLHKSLFNFDSLSETSLAYQEGAADNWLAQLEEEFAELPQDVDFFCRNKYDQIFDLYNGGLSKQAVDELVQKCLQDDKLAKHALRMFLLAQCAKDCSIMICFERSEKQEDLHFKVGVVDMDPKPVNKIPHYLEMDRIIIDTFLSNKGLI
jgi:inositol-pentakisphosphate 2-kinase